MGIETILGAVAPAVIGGLMGKSSANNAPTQQTVTNQNQLDPRIAAMLFGSGQGTQKLKAGAIPQNQTIDGVTRQVYSPSDYETVNDAGLLGRYQGMLDQPMSQALQGVLGSAEKSLGQNFGSDQTAIRAGLSQLMQGQAAPQMQAAQSYNGNYMRGVEAALPKQYTAAQGLLTQSAPAGSYDVAKVSTNGITPAETATAAINAPSQNTLNLKDAYNQMIYGASGANPYLTGGIQKGINQSQTAFENMQTDATRNLTENILGNIRGGAVAAGQYGGSRQGLAESNALKDYSTQIGRAMSQFGQNNTDAAIAAQAAAYNQDQANKLSAMNTLGGQQYGAAAQQAQLVQQAALANQAAQMRASELKGQAEQFNAGNQTAANQAQFAANQQSNLANTAAANNMAQFNAANQQQANQQGYQGALSNAQFNAGNQQQANQINYQGNLQNNQFNTGNQQQANQANLNAQLGTNQLNQSGLLSGISGLSGLGQTNYNIANQLGDYNINRAQQVNSLLSPYLSANSSSTTSQPLYTNKNANILGGAIQGAQLGQSLGGIDFGNLGKYLGVSF